MTAAAHADVAWKRRPRISVGRALLYAFLVLTAALWIVPIAGAIFASFRPFHDTIQDGFFSWPKHLTLNNYQNAWAQGDILHKYWNTTLILVPSLLLTLFFSSMVAFVCSRFSWRFNIFLLCVFTAGNLLPQQILLTPLYQAYRLWDDQNWVVEHQAFIYDTYWGVIAIHVAFQIGFCTFVLTNYMQTLPHELTEAALVDGAGAWRQYWTITMPLCRPPLAALATLEFTWIYNDFLWALVLMNTGDKRPITSALNNLRGEFFTDNNLLAAGSVIIVLPTVLVFVLLQKQFVGGLTLGANKG